MGTANFGVGCSLHFGCDVFGVFLIGLLPQKVDFQCASGKSKVRTIKFSKNHSIKKYFSNVHQESRGFAISKSSSTKSVKSLNPIFSPNLCHLYVHSASFCPLEGSVCGMGRDGIHIGCLAR
jgi:hypothetical protein